MGRKEKSSLSLLVVFCLIGMLILIILNNHRLIGSKSSNENKNVKNNKEIKGVIRREFELDKYIEFNERFEKFLNNTDRLDLSSGDTVWFEARNQCYFAANNNRIHRLKNGNYVISAHYPSSFIAIFSSSGRFIREIGRKGDGPGEYRNPNFIDIKNDTIYCYDFGKKVIRYLSNDKFIDEFRITDRSYFCSDFKVSPINGSIIFYNVFLNLRSHILSILSFNKNNKTLLSHGDFGLMKDVSVVSRIYDVRGLEVYKNGYIFALDPQRFGYTVCNPDGKELISFYNEKFKKLKLLKKISKLDMTNQQKYHDLFFSHSRCRFIHYLGKGILGISVENPKRKGDKIIPFYYTFWRVDGKYLGYLKCTHRIVDGHNGTLYYWIEELPKLENGMYGNPMLVSVKVF